MTPVCALVILGSFVFRDPRLRGLGFCGEKPGVSLWGIGVLALSRPKFERENDQGDAESICSEPPCEHDGKPS
jgi:hypothetical protein